MKNNIAKYILQVSKYKPILFDNLELIISKPDTTSFNRMIRNRLTELNVDYREDEG